MESEKVALDHEAECAEITGERDYRSISSIVMTGQKRQFHIKLILKIERTNYGSFLLFYVFFCQQYERSRRKP